jgi:hypothetical protein
LQLQFFHALILPRTTANNAPPGERVGVQARKRSHHHMQLQLFPLIFPLIALIGLSYQEERANTCHKDTRSFRPTHSTTRIMYVVVSTVDNPRCIF